MTVNGKYPLSSFPRFCRRIGEGRHPLAEVALEIIRHFSTQNDVLRNLLRNSILMTRTTQIWVVLLIGRAALEIYFNQLEAPPSSHSVWNFCARFSDVTSRGNQWWRREMSAVFSGYTSPLSANSDRKQFSPNNIHTLSKDKVMRINKMINKRNMPWSFIKFSQVVLKKIYGDQFGEFVCGYWGLKG